MTDWRVRDATADDADACAAIYAPYVRDTAISFELVPPDADELARRIAAAQVGHAWLVATAPDDRPGGRLRLRLHLPHPRGLPALLRGQRLPRARPASRRRRSRPLPGIAPPARRRGLRLALAGMALPNEASVGLHTALGFEPVGTFRRVGWKHGRWHDVAWMQRALTDTPDAPPAD